MGRMKEVYQSKEMMLSVEELEGIGAGYQMDVRDEFGKYLKAKVVEVERDRIKISFVGWKKMWDKWMDVENDRHLMALFGSISDRQINKMQLKKLGIGDKVMIQMPAYHEHAAYGWMNAEIINMDKGQ